MSPLALRRYRADRLLRSEFEGLRAGVVAGVRARLAGSGVVLDDADLDACYAQAWQGLYAAVLDGQEIASPGGWLVTVCFRRAIDEHRSRSLPGRRLASEDDVSAGAVGSDGDFATELDDRDRLLRLMEGIGASMSGREREAASLCLLQGLSRAQAAREMGIAPRRLERLMDGRGARRPGVAAKLGALTETIAAGRFCEERASAMRALAFGVLDPEGERHRLAMAHQRSCPACRAYVLQLRGLAASVLPPVLLPGIFAAARSGAEGATAGSATRSCRRLTRSRVSARSRVAGRSLARIRAAVGRATAPAGAAGTAPAGTAGLGSALATKLAVVGIAVAGLGAGAVALSSSGHGARGASAAVGRSAGAGSSLGSHLTERRAAAMLHRVDARPRDVHRTRASSKLLRRSLLLDTQRRAIEPDGAVALREFGFERHSRSSRHARSAGAPRRTTVSSTRVRTRPASEGTAVTATPSPLAAPEAEAPRESSSVDPTTSARAQALREFGIE